MWLSYETTFITSQNREVSIYVSCSGVILFNDVTAADILWMWRKLNTLKMVADISWLHNTQDHYQPIEQPPITKESLLSLQQPWLHIRYGWKCSGCLRNSSITAHTDHSLFVLMALQFQVCFQAALKANVTSQPSISNQNSAEWPKDFQLKPFSALETAEYVFFELPASTIHYFFFLQLLSFLLPTRIIYETVVQTSFC